MKAHWNHRVVKRVVISPSGFKEEIFGIHEAHYKGKQKNPYTITADPVAVAAESAEALADILERMKLALDKPILNWEDF